MIYRYFEISSKLVENYFENVFINFLIVIYRIELYRFVLN